MKSLRLRAIDLRRRGWSYSVISGRLGIAKSTLSHWLREVPYEPNSVVLKRIRAGPAQAAVSKHREKIREISFFKKRGLKDIGRISRRDLLFLGLGLYLGEGSKLYEEVRIINADPQIIQLAMRWFRDIGQIPNRNFAIAIHIYPDTSEEAALKYWAKIVKIPRRQFERVQVDRRLNKSWKKKRRLPYGTAHLKIRSRGDRRFGVSLHRRIMGWVEAVYQIMRA